MVVRNRRLAVPPRDGRHQQRASHAARRQRAQGLVPGPARQARGVRRSSTSRTCPRCATGRSVTAPSDAGGDHVLVGQRRQLVGEARRSSTRVRTARPRRSRRARRHVRGRRCGSTATASARRRPRRRARTPVCVAALLGRSDRRRARARSSRSGTAWCTAVRRTPRRCVIDDDVLAALESLVPLAPLHLPGNLAGIDATRRPCPACRRSRCSTPRSTARMPERAAQYAVPQAWRDDLGVRRYGFHGTSHRVRQRRARRAAGSTMRDVRMVTLHLGNGCSAAAVRDGRVGRHHDGLHAARGPRHGHAQRRHRPRRDPVRRRASRHRRRRGRRAASTTESGLLGVSGSSNDMRDAARGGRRRRSPTPRSRSTLFCYRAAKHVAALSVALGRPRRRGVHRRHRRELRRGARRGSSSTSASSGSSSTPP